MYEKLSGQMAQLGEQVGQLARLYDTDEKQLVDMLERIAYLMGYAAHVLKEPKDYPVDDTEQQWGIQVAARDIKGALKEAGVYGYYQDDLEYLTKRALESLKGWETGTP